MTKPSDAQAMEEAAKAHAEKFGDQDNPQGWDAFHAGVIWARAKQSVEVDGLVMVLENAQNCLRYIHEEFLNQAHPRDYVVSVRREIKAALARYKESGK